MFQTRTVVIALSLVGILAPSPALACDGWPPSLLVIMLTSAGVFFLWPIVLAGFVLSSLIIKRLSTLNLGKSILLCLAANAVYVAMGLGTTNALLVTDHLAEPIFSDAAIFYFDLVMVSCISLSVVTVLTRFIWKESFLKVFAVISIPSALANLAGCCVWIFISR